MVRRVCARSGFDGVTGGVWFWLAGRGRAGHAVVLERPLDAAAELRGLASRVPRTRSLVEELFAERRSAATVGE